MLLPVAAIVLGAFNIAGCIRPPKVSLSDIEISSMSFRRLELDETKLTDLPDGRTVELVIPVRVRLAALAGAAGKLITDWRSVKFDGQFKLKTPLSLRQMLLGKPLRKKP